MRLSARAIALVCVLSAIPLAFLTVHAAQTAENPSSGAPDTAPEQPQEAAVGETRTKASGSSVAVKPFSMLQGPPAPPLPFRTLDGRSKKLADFGDKVVLLNLWATSCDPCKADFNILKALYDEFSKDERFVMIGLSVDTDIEAPRRYMAEHEKELPWLQGFLGSAKLPWLQQYLGGPKSVKDGVPLYFVVGPGGRFFGGILDMRRLAAMTSPRGAASAERTAARLFGDLLRAVVASALETAWDEKATPRALGGDKVAAPARAAGKKSNAPDVFSAVTERVVHADHVGENCVMDLENGQRFSPPKPGVARSYVKWIKQNGIDVGAVVNAQIRGLWGFEMVVIPVENALWETATPSYLRAVVTWPEPGTLVAMSGLGLLPKTYLFKTREGGMGVLQVLGFVSEPDGVKFRYKRLQAESKDVAPASEKADPPSASQAAEVDAAFEAKPESAPRFEVTPDGPVEWIEVARLSYNGAKPGSGLTAALQPGVIAINPLESGRLGIFLARPAPGILGTLLMRMKVARPDLRIVFIDQAGERHLARQPGMAHSGLKKVRIHRFENPKSCPLEQIRTIVFEQPEFSKDKTVRRQWEAKMAELAEVSPLPKPVVGRPYAFALTDIRGHQLETKDFRGRVIVLDFWATWCGPCHGETLDLLKLYERYHERGLDIIGISLDQNRRVLEAYLTKYDIPWPQVMIGQELRASFEAVTGVSGIPRYFVVDPNGNLHTARGRGRLETIVEELLKTSPL